MNFCGQLKEKRKLLVEKIKRLKGKKDIIDIIKKAQSVKELEEIILLRDESVQIIKEIEEIISQYYSPYYYPRSLETVVEKEDYKTIEVLDNKSPVHTLQVLPDSRIVSGSGDKTIIIWERNPQTGKYEEKEKLKGHTDLVWILQVLPDGRIVSGSDDKTIRIWEKNPQTGKYEEKEKLEGHTDWVRTLQVLKDGRIESGKRILKQESMKKKRSWKGIQIGLTPSKSCPTARLFREAVMEPL
jgi:WD40 repeat protein